MTQPTLWTQEQLAQHWRLSEGTLERWCCESIGPVYLKKVVNVLPVRAFSMVEAQPHRSL